MTTKTTNLFNFFVPPPRENVRVSLKKDLVVELESFHEFIREHEGEHVELGHVFEHIFDHYFSSARKELRVYRQWKEEDSAPVTEKPEEKEDSKEEDSTPVTEMPEGFEEEVSPAVTETSGTYIGGIRKISR